MRDRAKRLKRESIAVARELAKFDADAGAKQRACGSWVVWRGYYEAQEWRLRESNWCQRARTCAPCARARGIQYARRYADLSAELLALHPEWRPWLVTFTVRNGSDLGERLKHLLDSFRAGWERRKNHAKGLRGWSAFCAPEAVVGSIEIKRGKGSGLWHPHLHMVWMVPIAVGWDFAGDERFLRSEQVRLLQDEWLQVTGDSFMVNATAMSTCVDMDVGRLEPDRVFKDHLEVFKYLCKPGEMKPRDVVEAWQVTARRRMIRSWAGYRGVSLPESLADDPLAGRYVDVFHEWLDGSYREKWRKEGFE